MINFIRNLLKQKSEPVEEDLDNLKMNIKTSFSHLKDDIAKQKVWINYLYNNHSLPITRLMDHPAQDIF